MKVTVYTLHFSIARRQNLQYLKGKMSYASSWTCLYMIHVIILWSKMELSFMEPTFQQYEVLHLLDKNRPH